MKTRSWTVLPALLAAAAGLQASAADAPPATRPARETTGLEIKWVRDSVEYATLTRMVYALATRAVQQAGPAATSAPRAVVLDLDETALDNSVFQLERLAYGLPYTTADWDAWCARRAAGSVPGVEGFIVAARAAGLRVAWISDRRESTRAATQANLKALELWGPGDLLCLKNEDPLYDKAARRRELRTGAGACSLGAAAGVVAWVGDQVTDFPGAAEPAPNAGQAELFGREFFLLPNPMYGRWTNAVTRPMP